ncbi:hypothetical protein [Salipiger mangrovisoli]|uniref:Uncharacterized protein n=1 Tax=Salipiger mangrovisoli TaxID=2865933 RepID=A0ABR9X497_9RHOB|nr:hypothetical protein [Salipiger mangrovisoli]MBE9638410.1 hypothetical protein [Salipiger mangrovisoli]
MKGLVAALMLAAGAAHAHPEAADCAALWQGAALEIADDPSPGDSSESASLLARQFSLSAAAGGLTGPTLRAAILEALPGYRLLYRGVLAGDAQSRALFERRSEDCSHLLPQG